MLSDSALSGYQYDLPEGCCRESCCCGRFSEGQPIGKGAGRDYNQLTREHIARVAGWINLLKHIKLNTTPDVILSYLYATGLINSVMDSLPEGEACCWPSGSSDDGFKIYRPDKCCDTSMEFSDCTKFPKEIVTMATEYLFHRVHAFVNTINDCMGWYPDIHTGIMIPNTIVNSLKGFELTTTNDDDIDLKLKALHASMIPDYCDSYGRYCGSRQFPSVKWDPSTRSNDGCTDVCVGGASAGFTKADADFVIKSNVVFSAVSNIYCRLCDALRDHDTARVVKLIETYTTGIEITMYISCWSRGINALAMLACIPEAYAANMMFLDETADKNDNPAISRSYFDRIGRNALEDIAALRKLSPEAAITIGDLFTGGSMSHQIKYSCSWVLANYLNNKKGEVYDCVAQFLVREIQFQRMVNRDTADRIRKMRSNVPNTDSGCCCKG